jgi:hypothetical protein
MTEPATMSKGYKKKTSFRRTSEAIKRLIDCTQRHEKTTVIAKHLVCNEATVRKMQVELGLRVRLVKQIWSAEEIEQLRYLYPTTDINSLIAIFHRNRKKIILKANKLGLHKTKQFFSVLCAKTLVNNEKANFHPGNFHPGNFRCEKELMLYTQRQNMRQLAPRQRIGIIHRNANGYWERKVSDTSCRHKNWVFEHILVWQRTHGPIPRGYTVCFKDGNINHITEDNLELVSRKELMLRNSVNRLPKDLNNVIRLNGVLNRKVRELNEKQTQRSLQSSF